MPRYRIPIVEHAWGSVIIEADTLEDAKRIADERELDGSEQYYYHVTEVDFEVGEIEVDE